jgi:2',3'-cyclic-nucleotide 2'-phosphodiesterase/3'-nucleotidase
MKSYRLGHLTRKGGVLEGRDFSVLFDTKTVYGEEAGTIRNLAIKYLMEEKEGQYQGKTMQRWKLSGLTGYDKERKIVKDLINAGKVDVLKSKNGRYTNVTAINVKDFMFTSNDKANAEVTALKQKLKKANDQEKIVIQQSITLINALK